MKKILFVVFGIFLLISCEKELVFQAPYEPAQNVLYSFLEKDSILKVHVSKSVSITSPLNKDVANNGVISVFEDSVLIAERYYAGDTGWVNFTGIKLKSSSLYGIRYSSDSNVWMKGASVIPQPVKLIKVDTIFDRLNSRDLSDSIMICKVTFKDSVKFENKYQLSVRSYVKKVGEAEFNSSSEIDFDKSDKIFLSTLRAAGVWEGINFEGLFEDASIDGKSYTIAVDLPMRYLRLGNGESEKYVEFRLYTLSYEYFEYYRSRKIADGYHGVPFLDPVKIYSNIENGLGCVGGIAFHSININAGK